VLDLIIVAVERQVF